MDGRNERTKDKERGRGQFRGMGLHWAGLDLRVAVNRRPWGPTLRTWHVLLFVLHNFNVLSVEADTIDSSSINWT